MQKQMNQLKLIEHPFNSRIGLKSISDNTSNLILGSFPPYQVTEKLDYRIDYYYGSKDNAFWDLFFNALDIKENISEEEISSVLNIRNFGILDIVKTCYRKDGNLSSDTDLAIIDQEDLIPILSYSQIRNVYCTSQFVRSMLFDQIIPAFSIEKKLNLVERELEGFVYHEIINNEMVNFRIFSLYSPSPQGLRGLQKRLNLIGSTESPEQYRLRQYRTFLNFI